MSPSSLVQIAAFYHFVKLPPSQVEGLAKELEKIGKRRGLRGLIILASEGINGTISGTDKESVLAFLKDAKDRMGVEHLEPKWSAAEHWPFRKFKVRRRQEIVTLGKPEIQPLQMKSATHLSPKQWHETISSEDVIVLDTRNWYETKIGKFSGAVDPNLDEFHEFSDYLSHSDLPKNKKILIYCTGGIRCEKAIVEMHNHGFSQVYQLDGGILNYLAQFPRAKFEGECFVFDNRVAVDQDLQPTVQYAMCPHCGQPADQELQCLRCAQSSRICMKCAEIEARQTCSRNCAHHYALQPGKQGRCQQHEIKLRRKSAAVRQV